MYWLLLRVKSKAASLKKATHTRVAFLCTGRAVFSERQEAGSDMHRTCGIPR